MARLEINTGSGPNSRDGDSLRSAFVKINSNFNELYGTATAIATNPPATSLGVIGDQLGLIAFTQTHMYYCTGSYDGSTHIWKRIAWPGDVW
jgi:hypothetical protein